MCERDLVGRLNGLGGTLKAFLLLLIGVDESFWNLEPTTYDAPGEGFERPCENEGREIGRNVSASGESALAYDRF
jgi:hypothetical protein